MLVGMRVGPGSPAVLLVVGRGRRVPDWPHHLAASVAHRPWTRVTWSRLGTSSWPCGLCTRWRFSLCPLVESPVNMQPKFQQSLPIDRRWIVPFPFIDRVLDIAGMLQICAEDCGVHGAVLGRSCYRACCCERQERMGPDSAENGPEVPQVQFLWTSLRACGDKCRCSREVLQTGPWTKSWTASVWIFFRRFTHFSHPSEGSACPIFSPGALAAVSARGLLGVLESPGVVLPGDSAHSYQSQ